MQWLLLSFEGSGMWPKLIRFPLGLCKQNKDTQIYKEQAPQILSLDRSILGSREGQDKEEALLNLYFLPTTGWDKPRTQTAEGEGKPHSADTAPIAPPRVNDIKIHNQIQ